MPGRSSFGGCDTISGGASDFPSWPDLFRPFPHYQRGSLSTRSIDVSVPKLISDDGEKTLLIGPYPVREGTSFNVNGDQMIFHTDRVSTEVGYGPLNDCCVLFRGPRHTAAGSEFWKISAPFGAGPNGSIFFCPPWLTIIETRVHAPTSSLDP